MNNFVTVVGFTLCSAWIYGIKTVSVIQWFLNVSNEVIFVFKMVLMLFHFVSIDETKIHAARINLHIYRNGILHHFLVIRFVRGNAWFWTSFFDHRTSPALYKSIQQWSRYAACHSLRVGYDWNIGRFVQPTYKSGDI